MRSYSRLIVSAVAAALIAGSGSAQITGGGGPIGGVVGGLGGLGGGLGGTVGGAVGQVGGALGSVGGTIGGLASSGAPGTLTNGLAGNRFITGPVNLNQVA